MKNKIKLWISEVYLFVPANEFAVLNIDKKIRRKKLNEYNCFCTLPTTNS